VDLLSDEIVAREGGFLAIRRLRCVNVRADGSRSAPYLCDFVVRPKGLDAVVVAVYSRAGGRVRVLVRGGLRIPLAVGRAGAPVAEAPRGFFFHEVGAGIVETDHGGVGGIRRRAALAGEGEAGCPV